ncbi:MAG: hypothetical protein EBR30_12030 [Cytophagia bacterium]|nr:hypothetical protein [Cytophagia bacterium]
MPAKNVSVKRNQFDSSSLSAAASGSFAATNTEEVSRRFNLLKEETPELGGKVLWQLANSSTPDAMLLSSAARALDLTQIKQGVENLKAESKEKQKVAWENMSPAKQQIYLENGYEVPKDSSPWWKSALGTVAAPFKAVSSGIGWVWDKSGADSTIGVAASSVGSLIGTGFNAMTWTQDQLVNRPFRALVDTTGQNQEARLDLTFEEARQSLEKQGVNLTNDEWEYLKWKYVEVNGFKRTYYGREGDDPQGAMIARMMATGVPGGPAAMGVFDAISSINQVGDIAKDIPLLGKIVADPKSENPYDKKRASSSATVSNSIFDRFNAEVKKLSENEDYNLSPWSSWNRATTGTSFISPIKQVESISKLRGAGLDSNAFDYAIYRAKGRTPEEWITDIEGIDPSDPRYLGRRQFLTQYESVKDFKDVVDDLKSDASKYSIGRGYAHAFGLPEDSALFTAVSGAADAAVMITLDPTIFLGKANKVWRVVRKGVQIADLSRVRFFAKGLQEGGNILDRAIIEGAENISKVRESTKLISSESPNLERVFSRSKLDELAPLVDESGIVSDFAIENFDEINTFLDDAQKSLVNLRSNLKDLVDSEVTNTSNEIIRDFSIENFEEINQTLDAIETAKGVMSRIPPPDPTLKPVGRLLSLARVKQAEKYNRFIETVTDGFKALRAAEGDEYYLKINDLRRNIKNGNAIVDLMVQYDKELIERGFAGLDNYDSVWDFIEANKMIWGTGRGTGQAVRGFGNGMKITDSWRLFSSGVESAVFDRNTYMMLPELSKPGVFIRKVAAKSETALDELKRLKDLKASTDLDISAATNFAARIFSKPLRMTGDLVWNLTHHVPKSNGVMGLTGPDAIAEFEKLLNYGVFAGMSRKDRDIFMGKFILGLGEDTVERWIFNGTLQEGTKAAKLWNDIIGINGDAKLNAALRNAQGLVFDPNEVQLAGAPMRAIFNTDGTLTSYGVENFDALKAVVWDYFKDDLDNPVLDIFKKQVGVNARSSTLASRFMVERLFLEDLFARTGMDATANGKEVVDRFLNQLLSSRYAPNNLDVVGLGESAQRVALLPTVQYDELVAFPDFIKDIQKNATQLGLLSRTLRRTFNLNFVETLMGTYWKPFTLMRLGFIPRAAGEEFLAFYARAGIYAPLSFMAAQSAADRRGLLGALTNLPGRISAKKFGEIGRAGLGDELWKISAMVPYANVSNYIADVAGKVAEATGKQLNRFDHLALMSSYWTGTVAKNIKQIEFRLLPDILKAGVVRSVTEKNQKWVQEGLVTLDGLSNIVLDAANAAMRDPLHQQAIAAAHVESGRTVTPNPADDAKPTMELTVRKGRYGREEEKVTVELSHEFEAIDSIDDASLTDISYAYSLAGEEQVLRPVYEILASTVDEATLDGGIAPILNGTEWSVPTTVVEPELVASTNVVEGYGNLDIADVSNFDVGGTATGNPDILDRYVEVLQSRANNLPPERIGGVADEVLLPNRTPEFTTEGYISYDDFIASSAAEQGAKVTELSDYDLLRLRLEDIRASELNQTTDFVPGQQDWQKLVDDEWNRRQALQKYQPDFISAKIREIQGTHNIDLPYDPTDLFVPASDVTKLPYDIPAEAISRASVVADLRRIANRQSLPSRSIWFNDDVLEASDEANGLRGLAQQIFDRGRVEPPVAAATSARTVRSAQDILDAANNFRNDFQNLSRLDRSLVHQWIQGVDGVPNGSGIAPDLVARGLNPDHPLLTPTMKALMQRSTTNSVWDQLIISGLAKAKNGDDSLLRVLDVLTRTESTRFRQILTSNFKIKIGTRAELLAEIKPIIVRQLQDPAFATQVRGSRRYLVNSVNSAKLRVPLKDNQIPIYFPMVEADWVVDIVDSLSKLSDSELYSFLARAAGPDEITPEVVDSIKQILVNFGTTQSRSWATARAAASEGSLIPLNAIGFLDYDHALAVKEALQNIEYRQILAPGSQRYARTASGEEVLTNPTFRLGQGLAFVEDKNIVRMPNSPFAHRALDDGVAFNARPIDEINVTRFDDNGFIDDFGRNVIEGETIDSNLEAWAEQLTRFVDTLFFSQDGRVLDEVIQPILRNSFGVEAMSTIPTAALPSTLFRPKKFIPPGENFIQKVARVGFGQIINPAIFALVRHPMYLLAFSNGYEFARANNALFRNVALDRFAAGWAKRNSVDLNEVKNLWTMIPADRAEAIYTVDGLLDELQLLNGAGKINPESPLLQVTRLAGQGKLSEKESKDLVGIIDWIKMDRNVENINVSVAMDRAMNEMIPYIDDHQVRSFFQDYARNIMPFEFAQEQFLKRWARTVTYSPESFRRIQLLSHAFTNNGFVEEQNGQKYFVIPGTESLNELLGKVPVFKNLFGGNVNMPISIPMGLNTRNVLPGIPSDLENLPSFSPFAMIGIEQLANHFPEVKKIAQEFNAGRPIDTNQGFIDSLLDFVPQNYQRLYAGLIGGYANSPKGMEAELSRNAIAAIQQAEAEAARLRIEQQQLIRLGKQEEAAAMQVRINQLAPPPNASPEQVSKYLDTIKDWTRANLFVRGALGFITPTTTVNLFEGKELAAEFGVLLGQMSFDEALAVFLAEHPNGAAYTVFSTSKSSKAPLPRTEKAIKWIQDNDGWMQSYSMAAPWLVPQSDSTDDFSQQAYKDMLGFGLRNVKNVDQWYGDFKFAAGANIYFPTKLKYDVAKSQTTNSKTRAALEAQWQAESAVIKLQNPVFADRLSKMVSSDAEKTMQEMKAIFALPNDQLPKIDHIESLRAAVEAWDIYSAEYLAVAGKNSKAARNRRAQLQQSFIAYGNDLLTKFPEVRSFWNSIVLPSLDLTTKKTILEIGGR